ncbi:hypothetical protein IWQ56_003032 [Coemansia nantahalensis]|nr:hypothetical protein IWQ56_003032 [Coemansia nantahalensis]
MIWTSSYAELEIPDADIPTFYFEYAKQHSVYGRQPGRTAIVDGEQSLTFAQLEHSTAAFASGLHHGLGFAPGDMLAVLLPNTAYFPVAAMGALMAGGVVTTANPAYTEHELAHQFQLTEPKVVVTKQASVPVVRKALAIAGLALPDACIVTVDGGAHDIRAVFSERPFPRVHLRGRGEAARTTAFIVFSSGTSGKPKGVALSHTNIIANALQFFATYAQDTALHAVTSHLTERRWLQVLPMFHIYGILVSNVCVLSGAAMVIMEKFDFVGFCSLIERHRIDTVYVAPPVILAMVKSPVTRKFDLSSLKSMCSGAAPLTKELEIEAEQKLKVFVHQGYGMSETSPIVSRSLCGQGAPGSAGRLCPNTEAIFVDDSGARLGPGQVGELCVRGPQVMLRYYKNAQATAETLDGDGFLHTGDIGYICDKGNLYITDRKKELIKYKGFQVAPAELEGLLLDHPAVADAAVIPVYSEEQATELPKAYVVVHPDAKKPGIEEAIGKWVAERVVAYKKLRGGIELIGAIPKSATGKILRKDLRALEAAKRKQAKL